MRNKRIGVGYDITAMILLGLIIVGCFLPWSIVRSELLGFTIRTGFDAFYSEVGMLYIILAVICLALIPAMGQSGFKKIILVGFGAILLFLNILIVYNIFELVRPYGTYIGYGKIFEARIGLGLYLELISSFGLIIIGTTVPTKGISKEIIPDELKRKPAFKQAPTIRYCSTCGEEIQFADKFCPFCGAAI